MQQRGVDLNQVDESFIEMAYGNMRTQAERDVRGAMLLDKVAEIEKVEVADAEVDEEINKMAEYYRASADEIRESLEKQGGGVENIRNNLKTRKAIEAVVAKRQKITEGRVDRRIGRPAGRKAEKGRKKEAGKEKGRKESG